MRPRCCVSGAGACGVVVRMQPADCEGTGVGVERGSGQHHCRIACGRAVGDNRFGRGFVVVVVVVVVVVDDDGVDGNNGGDKGEGDDWVVLVLMLVLVRGSSKTLSSSISCRCSYNTDVHAKVFMGDNGGPTDGSFVLPVLWSINCTFGLV